MNKTAFLIVAGILLFIADFARLMSVAHAHHFKGLPHFSYFENYPQVPQDEFLGQVGEYEMSLVIYDFQGIDRQDAQQPDSVRFYLVIFNLLDNKAYNGPLQLTILDGAQMVYTEHFESSHEESLYSIHHKLSSQGRYSLQVALEDEKKQTANIPFVLSSQKTAWGPWVAGSLIVLIGVAAVGSRRARVMIDRRANAQQQKIQAQK